MQSLYYVLIRTVVSRPSSLSTQHAKNNLSTFKAISGLQDVLDLAPQQLVPQALKAIKSRRAASLTTMRDPYIEQECAAIQEHENEQAEVVVVCEPEGTSLMMGGLHPR